MQGLVVGQGDSRLTPVGVRQVESLRDRLHEERNNEFWRTYSSDLQRTQETSRILLNDDKPTHLDARLRELAKGAREGYPKVLNEEEAIEQRKRDRNEQPLPRLETFDEGWERMKSWWEDVLSEYQRKSSMECSSSEEDVARVLVVSHAGILRVFLTRLIGNDIIKQLPQTKYDADGRLSVPNVCLSVIKVTFDTGSPELDVVAFTDVAHYQPEMQQPDKEALVVS